jgi:hypothetical protein
MTGETDGNPVPDVNPRQQNLTPSFGVPASAATLARGGDVSSKSAEPPCSAEVSAQDPTPGFVDAMMPDVLPTVATLLTIVVAEGTFQRGCGGCGLSGFFMGPLSGTRRWPKWGDDSTLTARRHQLGLDIQCQASWGAIDQNAKLWLSRPCPITTQRSELGDS